MPRSRHYFAESPYLLLGRRLISAAILIGIVLVAIAMDAWYPLLKAPGLWLLPILAFFVGGTAWEFGQLVRDRYSISPMVAAALSLALIGIASFPIFYVAAYQRPYPSDCPIGSLGWIGIGAVVVCGIAAVLMIQNFSTGSTHAMEGWSLLTLIAIYSGGFGAFWIAIRLAGEPQHALLTLIGIIAVTKITDSAAYFAGKSLGRNKLCPSISPGKTIEGAIAGFLAGMIAAWLYFACWMPWVEPMSANQSPWWGAVLVGFLLALVGLLGDLTESVVKRSVGEKDSGSLLPGLGGVWDVTDSLLPTTVVGYLGIVAHWI